METKTLRRGSFSSSLCYYNVSFMAIENENRSLVLVNGDAGTIGIILCDGDI